MAEFQPALNNLQAAFNYWLSLFPNNREIDTYSSQSQHGGPKGVTHKIAQSTIDPKIINFVCRKKYWAPGPHVCKLNNIRLIPKEDRNHEGETIKSEMLMMMKDYLDQGYNVTHVTIMPDRRIFNFNASKIYEYVRRFDAYADHEFVGPRGAAYYPLRLAEEFNEPIIGAMDQFF